LIEIRNFVGALLSLLLEEQKENIESYGVGEQLWMQQ
jgi:hypothetical protein